MLSTGTSAMSIIQTGLTDMQAQENTSLNIWGERKKSEKQRVKTLEGLRDAVAKIDADIHKSRAKTAATINSMMQQILIQVR